ncbi:MAG TPA: aminomethyltransferase family protein [Gemmatimonadales bacterium]|nr:aminomethyltransferase family protein [Gemmatimonadales bacterium]
MLKTTPFHTRTAALMQGQAWRRWAGYTVASAYELVHDREYAAVRNAAALFDVSPLYKYLISGPDATRLLDRMVTRDVTRCKVGQVMYTPWCDLHGKVIDDGTISRLAADRYRLTSAEPNLRWLSMNGAGMNVAIEEISGRLGALALQGPLSRTILQQIAAADLAGLKYFRLVETSIRGVPVTISRTGYTGDLGYEIWIPAEQAVPVWDALIEAGTPYGITPAGIWALDMARIEAGLVMLDVDYHSSHHALIEAQKSSPLELGLDWTVGWDKGPYNGRRALRAERARGPEWRFIGLSIDWVSLERLYAAVGLPPQIPSVAWRVSTPVYRHTKQIGYASSGSWSPLLKQYLALAHLRAPHFEPGTEVGIEVTVEHQRLQARARVTPLPFFDPERKKS